MKYLAYRLRSMLALLLLCSALCTSTASISAQEPYNDPATSAEEKIDRKTAQLKQKQSPSLADQMQLMARRAVSLMQSLQAQVFLYFNGWAETLGRWLFVLVLLISFLRLWRETGARSLESMGWWFVRVAICIGLLGAGPSIIDGLYGLGKDIAEGSSGNSVLARFYYKNQANFTESYAKIAMGTFTVKLNPSDKEGLKITPVEGGYSFTGVIRDQSSTLRDFNSDLKDSTQTMPKLFAWLGACRTILEFGDFWVAILGGVLLLVFKILAPFMIAFAVDREFARKFTLPCLYGLVILTLIWPAVSYFIRGLAYLFGNVAMAMGDADPVYAWNDATLQSFRSAQSQPLYTVLFACFTMTITAICLWASPVIASYIAAGRVYEGVSSALSSAAGTVVGAAMEWYTSNASAKLGQEASTTQANAAFDSEITRAGGELQYGDRLALSRQVAAKGQIAGDAYSQMRQIYATQKGQVLTADASLTLGNSTAEAAAGLAKGDIARQTNQQLAELDIGRNEKLAGIEADRASETRRWKGDKVMMGSAYAGYTLRNEGKEFFGSKGEGASEGAGEGGGGKAPLAIRGAATAIEVGGSAYGLYQQYQSIQDRAAGHTAAVNQATDARVQNLQQSQTAGFNNQDQYLQQVTGANQQYATDIKGAADASASIAASGAQGGAAIKLNAVNRSTEMELEANKIRNESQVEAAGITRKGAIDAARLHAMERVLSAVGSKIARDIERNMEMRF
jgi:hypothetical protein